MVFFFFFAGRRWVAVVQTDGRKRRDVEARRRGPGRKRVRRSFGCVVHAPTSSTGKANVRQLNAARTLPGCPPRCGPCFSGVKRQCYSDESSTVKTVR